MSGVWIMGECMVDDDEEDEKQEEMEVKQEEGEVFFFCPNIERR